MAVQADGKILAGYDYGQTNSAVGGVIRFNADGTIDPGFTAGNSDSSLVTDINVLSDNKLLIGGSFVSYNNQTHLRLVRTDANGNPDNTFNPLVSTLGTVYAVKRQTDGKIVIGGDFKFVNGVRQSALARLNPDGTLDHTFNIGSGIFGDVYALLIQPDGKIIAGGNFGNYNNNPAPSLVRINPNGDFDVSLNSNSVFVFPVFALTLQSDGKLLAGGVAVDPILGLNPVAVRINSNGSLDQSFSAPQMNNGSVRAITVQANGKIVIGGTILISARHHETALFALTAMAV